MVSVCQVEAWQPAIGYLQLLLEQNLSPDEITISSVMNACPGDQWQIAFLGALEHPDTHWSWLILWFIFIGSDFGSDIFGPNRKNDGVTACGFKMF